MSSRILLLLLFSVLFTISASAQTRPNFPDPSEGENATLEEMRVRWEIKYAEKSRLENLDRAREVAQLGSELYNSYTSNKTFGSTEKKKLDRLEKVTRKIRSQAGGSDGEMKDEDRPTQLDSALKRLAEVSAALKKAVEKTPRQVVSATVIERSNEVLELIRFVRLHTR